MRKSASAVRRGLRFTIATGVVAAGLVQLAPTATAADAKVERVGYTCKATNSVINTSLQGPQQFYVTAETTLPESVQPGETVAATKAKLTLFLPPKLVNRLYGPMKVRQVKGGSTSDTILQAVAPGAGLLETRKEPVRNLVVKNWVDLRPDQEVAIVAEGDVSAVPVPQVDGGNGLIYVQMPPQFVLHSEMNPPVIGAIDKADLNCIRDKSDAASRVIGTIKIGAGCSETECPLPAADANPTNPGGDGDTPGDGSGTDPEVIEPGEPVPVTQIDGYNDDNYGVSPADAASGGGSYRTTELPATGSPFGPGLLGVFGALVLARIALVLRSRRRRA
ncbi:hypothetical protein H9L21_14080 [Aeromicrobium senzhongii]|uniref:DUF6801 domain-containing protein n=1 Tax=Aeromicrobium senzhongii TaxID=2663859 RepID=A0ABX6SVA6_9ACTN|nr:DUF6801 domain-containing protein [Aeromicrobium senzhongii]MTB89686.1 hypothetical protein [Aeromicrobium senzhongii]QNL94190.1 hypothetical protein H9L21_14080 [Aeromicrobium senzhongii]